MTIDDAVARLRVFLKSLNPYFEVHEDIRAVLDELERERKLNLKLRRCQEDAAHWQTECGALRDRLEAAESVLKEAEHFAKHRPWPEHQFHAEIAKYRERFGGV